MGLDNQADGLNWSTTYTFWNTEFLEMVHISRWLLETWEKRQITLNEMEHCHDR